METEKQKQIDNKTERMMETEIDRERECVKERFPYMEGRETDTDNKTERQRE